MPYKLQVVVQQKTLGILSIQRLSPQAPMNHEQYELLIFSGVFVTLPMDTWQFLQKIMSSPLEIINTQQVVEKPT